MWFMTGIAASLLIGGYRFWSKISCPLNAHHRQEKGNIPYYWMERLHKRSPHSYYFGIDIEGLPEIEITPEYGFDRFAKTIGLSCEPQTGDALFDSEFYLSTDHSDYEQALRNSAEAREMIRLFFHRTRAHYLSIKRGMIYCYWRSDSNSIEGVTQYSAEALSALLQQLCQLLKDSMPQTRQKRHINSVKAGILMALHSCFGIFAIIGFVQLMFQKNEVYDSTIFYIGAMGGLMLSAIWLFLILAIMGRTSRTHLVLFDFSIIGLTGLIAGGALWTAVANTEYNTSAPTYQEVTLISKSFSKFRRSRSYNLRFSPSIGGEKYFVIKSTHAYYNHINVGDKRTLAVYPGWLNIPYGKLIN